MCCHSEFFKYIKLKIQVGKIIVFVIIKIIKSIINSTDKPHLLKHVNDYFKFKLKKKKKTVKKVEYNLFKYIKD